VQFCIVVKWWLLASSDDWNGRRCVLAEHSDAQVNMRLERRFRVRVDSNFGDC